MRVRTPSTLKAALVTGASTGIGAACAVHLDRIGFTVFGSVRKTSDGEALQAQSDGRIRPLLFDVTDADAVRRAAAEVTDAVGEAGLAGLVNNAGIAVAGPLEFLALDEIRRQLEVNVVGQIAVTQAFLPLLRQGRGRVVNMGSITGRVATPFIGAYSASKFALEAITDALRIELRPWDIAVVIVEPGAIATPIWEKSTHESVEKVQTMPAAARALYGKAFHAMGKLTARLAQKAAHPERVAEAVAHALTAPRPKTRYVVGSDARVQAALWKLLPDRVADWLLVKGMKLRG